MPRITSIALLIVGIFLLIYGINASNSFTSSVTQAVNGAPSDKAIWLIALGVLGIISGCGGFFFRSKP
jgi:hypothetical protein